MYLVPCRSTSDGQYEPGILKLELRESNPGGAPPCLLSEKVISKSRVYGDREVLDFDSSPREIYI